jgi:hypothetical protein
MSQASDNENFTGKLQADLKAAGFYHGAIDRWAGPSTIDAYNRSRGIVPTEPPAISPVVPTQFSELQKPSEFYLLPKDNQDALNSFYGTAMANGQDMTWFSFPFGGMRLYSRDGELLTSKVGDERPDHRAHRMIAGRLEAALLEIYTTFGQKRFETEGWHLYGGVYNYRKKVGGSTLSTHAWGISIDLNPGDNGWKKFICTFSPSGIDIMEKWGFLSAFRAWGHDAMHFQAAIPVISSGSYYAKHGLPKNIKLAD